MDSRNGCGSCGADGGSAKKCWRNYAGQTNTVSEDMNAENKNRRYKH